jgi:hypothetical protein
MATYVEIASDDFNRANDSIGGNYSMIDGGNMPTVDANTCRKPTGESLAIWSADAFADDQWAQVTLTQMRASWSSGGGEGVVLRGSVGKWYVVMGATGGTQVIGMDGAGAQNFYDSSDVTWSQGDVLRGEIVGNTISVLRNGTLMLTVDVSAKVIASGSAGLGFFSSNFGVNLLDDWSAGNIVSDTSNVVPSPIPRLVLAQGNL